MKDDVDDLAYVPALRWMANMICLWALCTKPACRRKRACACDPRFCLTFSAPLVPEEAREGVMVMLEGLQSGAVYDDLRDKAPDEIAALEEWIARVDESAARPSPVQTPMQVGSSRLAHIKCRSRACPRSGRASAAP